MTHSLLSSLVVGLTALLSQSQGSPTTESPSQVATETLGPGDHTRSVVMDGQQRTYLVHIPGNYDPKKPAPVVLALHGAAMDGSMMVWFSGLNTKSDEAGFIVVYPSGTGVGPFRTWNAGGFSGKMAEGRADDVAFLGKVLDDLAAVASVDGKRVYACGMSNGGMMCYRLAAELSDRIAAIAPVAGTLAIEQCRPKRAVPVIHFHGTRDNIVPFRMTREKPRVHEAEGGRRIDPDMGETEWLRRTARDRCHFERRRGSAGDALDLWQWEGRGRGRPGRDRRRRPHLAGQKPPVGFIGKSATNISANDLLWEFFEKHPMK